MQKNPKDLSEINDTTVEGKLLMAALAKLTCTPGYTDKTPDEVLAMIGSDANKMYLGHKDETRLTFRKAKIEMHKLRNLVESMENNPDEIFSSAARYVDLIKKYNYQAKRDEIHEPRHPWLQMRHGFTFLDQKISGSPVDMINKMRDLQSQIDKARSKQMKTQTEEVLGPILDGMHLVLDQMVEEIKRESGYQAPEKKGFAPGGMHHKADEPSDAAVKMGDKVFMRPETTGNLEYDQESLWYRSVKASILLEVEKWSAKMLELLKKLLKENPFIAEADSVQDLNFALNRLEKTLEESSVLDKELEEKRRSGSIGSNEPHKTAKGKEFDHQEAREAMQKLAKELLDDSLIMHKDDVQQLYYIRDLANDAFMFKVQGPSATNRSFPEVTSWEEIMDKIGWAVAESNTKRKDPTKRGPGFFDGDIITSQHYRKLMEITAMADHLLKNIWDGSRFKTADKEAEQIATNLAGHITDLKKEPGKKIVPEPGDERVPPGGFMGTIRVEEKQLQQLIHIKGLAVKLLNWSNGNGSDGEGGKSIRKRLGAAIDENNGLVDDRKNHPAAYRVEYMTLSEYIYFHEIRSSAQSLVDEFNSGSYSFSGPLAGCFERLRIMLEDKEIGAKLTDISVRQLEGYMNLEKSARDADQVFKKYEVGVIGLNIPGDLGTAMMHLRTTLQSFK